VANVLVEPTEAQWVVKGSKFIAYATPLSEPEAAALFFQSIRALHPKARHVGSAVRWDREWERWDDDGEPSGSTGRPILHALQSAEAVRTAVGVVRYFGGTLLGVPGLVRAYRGAAELALAAGAWVPYVPVQTWWVHCDYPDLSTALRWIREVEGTVRSQRVDSQCVLEVDIPEHLESQWKARCLAYGSPLQLVNETGGSVL
jgi:putative IMPACT (imprinted ancient) family translation regulator